MYQGLEAQLHDVFWEAEAPGVELELIKHHLSGREGRVLEIGCGSGRILLPLLEAKYMVDGLDVSKDMLAILENNKQAHQDCKLIHGEVIGTDIKPYKHFLIPAFTLMLMGENGGLETLRYISDNAEDGASLFLTVFIPWAEICGELEENQWFKDHEAETKSGKKASCKTRFTIDRTHQLLHRKHKYELKAKDGIQKAESEQTLRWYTYQELLLILEISGWKLEQSIFDFELGGDSENAHLLTLTAIKQ